MSLVRWRRIHSFLYGFGLMCDDTAINPPGPMRSKEDSQRGARCVFFRNAARLLGIDRFDDDADVDAAYDRLLPLLAEEAAIRAERLRSVTYDKFVYPNIKKEYPKL